MRATKKNDSRGPNVVHRQPRLQRRVHVGDAVGEGEGHLLRRRRAGLGHVVAGDRDGVPPRDLLSAVGERVRDEPQGRFRRVDIRAARDVLLQHVVLDRAGQLPARNAMLFGDELIEQQQHRGRRVDRHRRRHLVQRDAVEQQPHVLDRVDRHADLAHLTVRQRGIGVQAHLGRQVERDGQPGGARREQLVVAGIGLGGGSESGVLAHGPGPLGVHGRVDAPGERVGAGLAQPLVQSGRDIARGVQRGDLESGFRLAGHPFSVPSPGTTENPL